MLPPLCQEGVKLLGLERHPTRLPPQDEGICGSPRSTSGQKNGQTVPLISIRHQCFKNPAFAQQNEMRRELHGLRYQSTMRHTLNTHINNESLQNDETTSHVYDHGTAV